MSTQVKTNRTSARTFRRDAWMALEGNRGSALGITLLSVLFGGIGRGSFRRFFLILGCAAYLVAGVMALTDASVMSYVSKVAECVNGVYDALYALLSPFLTDMSSTLGIDLFHLRAILETAFVVALCGFSLFLFWSVFGEAFYVGRCRWHLDRVDGLPSDGSVLFSAFGSHFWKAFLLRLTRALLVFAWSLLLVIPGIIAAYRYSMADWVLAENPSLRVRDALRESARMMQHNKWRYFCLRFSFVGWHFIAILSLGIQYLWLLPYIHQAKTQFYDEVSRRHSIRDTLDEAKALSVNLWDEADKALENNI